MICTSIPLRTSTGISPGFILVLDRSPPLGYTLCRSTALSPRARGPGSEGRVAGYHHRVGRHTFVASPLCSPLALLLQRAKGEEGATCFRCACRARLGPLPLAAECNSLVRVSRRALWHRTSVRCKTVGHAWIASQYALGAGAAANGAF